MLESGPVSAARVRDKAVPGACELPSELEVTSPGEIDERPGIGHDDHERPSWLSSCSRSAAG
jgi:hypothetical protein